MASRRSFGFGLENIGLWAARKPRLAGACLTVLLVICAAFVPQLKFDDNVNRVFMSDSVRADEFSRTLDMIGAGRSDIIVLFRSDQPIEAAQIATLRELSLDLEFEDGVVSVVSPFSARFAQTHPAYPGEPLFPFEFTTSELKARLSAYFSSDQPVGPLITQDLHMAMFIINYADDGRADHQRLFVDRLTSLIDARIGEEISATLTGETPMALKIADELKADLVRLNAAASAIIFLIGLVLFRNIWTALFALLPALLSAFVTLGLFAMLGYPITVVSNIIPVLVLVLALADNIHLIQHYRQHGK